MALPTGVKTSSNDTAWIHVNGSINVADSTLGVNTFVGPWTEVIGAKVGDRTRIQSHCVVCPGVTIGHDCFIAHGVIFTNDKFGIDADGRPHPHRDSVDWLETHIGNHVCIGSGAVILPVNICDNVIIGAGSVVTNDIVEPGVYAGNPARKKKRVKFEPCDSPVPTRVCVFCKYRSISRKKQGPKGSRKMYKCSNCNFFECTDCVRSPYYPFCEACESK